MGGAPGNGLQPVGLQVGIGPGKGPGAEETAMGGQGARVGAFDDVVLLADQGDLALGVRPPEDEHHGGPALSQGPDDGICQLLPPVTGMAFRPAVRHGQGGVEQEHPLLGPAQEIAIGGRRAAQITVQLYEDIAQGGRHPDAGLDGKGQAMGLTGAMVGVLAQDNHAHGFIRGFMQGGVNGIHRRKNPFLPVGLF